jgi:hypothetical protein
MRLHSLINKGLKLGGRTQIVIFSGLLFSIFFSITLFCLPGHSGKVEASRQQTSSIKIKQRNPVVNEGNQIKLSVIDGNGQPVNGAFWQSGSPDIAQVDPNTGEVQGMKQGFATITARQAAKAVRSLL